MRTRHLSINATCTFQCISEEPNSPNGLLEEPDIVIPGRKSLARSRSPGHPRGRVSGAQAEHVDFGQYVDEVGPVPTPRRLALTDLADPLNCIT